MKTLSFAQDKSYAAALSVTDTDSNCDSLLGFGEFTTDWGQDPIVSLAKFDTKPYRVYRLAKIPGKKNFAYWCDGNLITNMLTDAMIKNAGLKRFLFGAIGGAYRGKIAIDYLRFTKGAYAPCAPEKASAAFETKYDMSDVDEGFDPAGTTAAWKMIQGAEGTSVLSDGILSVDQPDGTMRYWESAALVPEARRGSLFTLEMRIKLVRTLPGVDSVLSVLAGAGSEGGGSCLLMIGKSKLEWRVGDLLKTICTGLNNMDGMHVFRLANVGGTYTLWRDGERIAEGLPSWGAFNYVRLGITSDRSHGGAFEVDYVRWTTDGAFHPVSPRKATVLFVR
jgi:hypothetical protein